MDAREILKTLVGFPTVSRDSNLDLIDWVEGYLEGHGVSPRRVYDETGTKAALYANVGPEVEGGVVLSGHTDVVPVDGQDWSTDPFEVVEKDGKLYGRGTADMKGFDALALAAVPKALERGIKRPLQIALSYDEEVGLLGAPPMIDDMVQHLPKAALAIIGEPTRMACVTGHKGGAGFDIHMRGYEVHSSLLHEGVSAIMEGARLIQWANDRNAENMAATPSDIAARFEPPWTTLHVGQIHGGTAHNITAKDCRFLLSFRCVPGDDPATWEARFLDEMARLDAEMKNVRAEAGITATRAFDAPLLEPEENGAAESFVRRLTGDNATHVVSYGTEAGHFQHRGYSAVVCGPGDIAQAHQPDEYIEISEMQKGEAFLDKVIETLAHD